jgi:hypothetical protein
MGMQEQREKAVAMVRAVYEDGEAEINGRKYKFHKMTHVQRRKVFAFYTSIAPQLRDDNMEFLDTPQYAAVEEVMWSNISFDGVALNKARDHWDEFPEDYVQLVATSLGVISYPFTRAAGIASASQAGEPAKTSSEKPM